MPTDFRPDWTDVVELVKGHWEAVGIDLQIRPLGRDLIRNRAPSANEHDAFVFIGNGGLDTDLYLESNNFFPHDDSGYRTFALLWSNWFAGLEPSEEPPASVQDQFDARRKLLLRRRPRGPEGRHADAHRRGEGRLLHDRHIPPPAPGYGIVSNDLRNVPDAIVNYGPLPYIGVVNPEQFFKVGKLTPRARTPPTRSASAGAPGSIGPDASCGGRDDAPSASERGPAGHAARRRARPAPECMNCLPSSPSAR